MRLKEIRAYLLFDSMDNPVTLALYEPAKSLPKAVMDYRFVESYVYGARLPASITSSFVEHSFIASNTILKTSPVSARVYIQFRRMLISTRSGHDIYRWQGFVPNFSHLETELFELAQRLSTPYLLPEKIE